jgi:hypothetical protein
LQRFAVKLEDRGLGRQADALLDAPVEVAAIGVLEIGVLGRDRVLAWKAPFSI